MIKGGGEKHNSGVGWKLQRWKEFIEMEEKMKSERERVVVVVVVSKPGSEISGALSTKSI